MAPIVALFLSSVLIFSVFSPVNSLSYNYYEKTCPHAESIIAYAVKTATSKDKTVPAALLRLHFHDCFIRVSILQAFNYVPTYYNLFILFLDFMFSLIVFFFFNRAVMLLCC